MAKVVTFESVKDEYAGLWAACIIRPEHKSEVVATARRIMANRPRYDGVSRATGVPWYVIGIIHSMECGLDFSKHLHNGDSLKRKTWQVPAGRPKSHDGPFTFEESAIDALTMPGKEFDKITDWSVERIAYVLELFNGWGYRLYRHIHSPYLWSFTNAYTSGKYVSDGVWSASAVSGQCGAMALLKAISEIDPHSLDLDKSPPAPVWPKAEPQLSEPKTVVQTAALIGKVAGTSRSVWSLLAAAFVAVGKGIEWLFNLLPDVTSDVEGQIGAIESLCKLLKINAVSISAVATVVFIAIAIWRHTRDKVELTQVKGDAK
jgi:lysozyme family protein